MKSGWRMSPGLELELSHLCSLRCLRIVKNKRLPDDISYRVMTFDTERALTTAKGMVTITVNHLTARAADRLGEDF